ncbi:hypothetical protein C8A03DRAFT_19280 [Achaetomium macrosporum]|uniref:Uncharacterized protein n=1 Tax=Achaetomium macrosporum TaxID=79813 RepID=A0AAN7C1M0_9PEZI|nr:hypothetical protein C8A03DRAFT_19280 [Achaetomium macrosporum]
MAPNLNAQSFFRSLLRRQPRVIKTRRMKPRKPKKPSLASLNHDMLLLVTQHLHDIDPQSVNSLALVCTALYRMARYVQYREVSIDLRQKRHEDNTADSGSLQSIVRNGLIPAIRTLHLDYSDFVKKYEQARPKMEALELSAWHVWNQLNDLIPMMSGLRHLHWDGSVIPDSVLEHLRKNPQIHLHLSLQGSAQRARWAEQEACLQRLPTTLEGTRHNLSSLRIKLVYHEARACRLLTQQALKQLLLSSPRLRALALDIAHPREGCRAYGYERDYCGFGLTNGEALPPLEELDVIGYPWGQQPSSPGWGINCLGYPEPTGTEMEYWARNLDWSHLRCMRLHDDAVPLAAHLAPQLTALEDLELRFYYSLGNPVWSVGNIWLTAVTAFFNTLPSFTLRSISLPGLPTNGPSTITAHASTLHSLSIHQTPLTDSTLTLFRDSLPHLKNLTIVCTRKADAWPHSTFTALASFPLLEYLEIYFPIGTAAEPDKPYLTLSTATDILNHLRSRGDGGAPSRLRQLRVHSGFPPRPFYGFPTESAYWPRDNVTSFVCWADGQSSCVKLSKAQNERLRRVVRGGSGPGSRMRREERDCIKFLVALKGPMRLEEWLKWKDEKKLRR